MFAIPTHGKWQLSRWLKFLFFLGLAAFPLLVSAQSEPYPAKTIYLVVPFPPGGAVDIVGRAISRSLATAWGKQVVVDNRPGASAMIGTEVVARAAPDGYTLLMGSMSSLAVNVSLHKSIRYDPIKDFAPVALIGHTPGIVAVNPKVPVTTIAELVKLAKSRPAGMTYASSGNGNFQHLVGEMFKRTTGANLVHVPYKGSAPALLDTIGGQVDMIFDVIPTGAPPVRSGQLRALAVTSINRSDVLPEVPTLSEAGLQGFNVTSWYGIVAPAGTPNEIIDKLNAEIVRIVKTPEMGAQLQKIGASPLGGSPADFSAHLKSEIARWSEVIRVNHIVPD